MFDPNFITPNMEMGEMMKVTVYCDFDFSSFPFDQQECNISLRERHLTSDIIFNENITLFCKGQMCKKPENGSIKLPDQHEISYKINMKLMGVTNLSFYGDTKSYYSYSTIKFSLERNTFGLLIGSFYLPTGLFGFLSLGSYIINPDIVRYELEILPSNYQIRLYNWYILLTGSRKTRTFDNTVFDNFQYLWFCQFQHCTT